MQKPDLHIVKPARDVDTDYPLDSEHPIKEITGEEEVWEPDGDVSRPIASIVLSLVSRSLAIVSVLAIITLILVGVLSAVFIAVDRPAPPSDVAMIGSPPEELELEPEPAEEPLSFHSFYEANLAPVTTVRSNVRRRRVKPRIHVRGHKVRRPMRRPPAPLVPLFMPTTLVIYVEDGVIKTRIEPWVQTTPSAKKRQQ
jgi:hypothetical protein